MIIERDRVLQRKAVANIVIETYMPAVEHVAIQVLDHGIAEFFKGGFSLRATAGHVEHHVLGLLLASGVHVAE